MPDWLTGGIKKLIEDGMDAAVRWFLTQLFAALETVLNGLGSWWLGVEAPGMGAGSASEAVSRSTIYFVAVAGIIGTAIGIIRVVRTHSRDSAADLVLAIFATIATTAIGGTVASYLLTITSQLSPWLLEYISGASGDERKSLYDALGYLPARTTSQFAIGIAIIAILLVFLAAIASLVNMFFVLFTYGVIAVLVGLLPIFAAQSQTEAGKQRFWKVIGWIFASVLYKPTAAVIYGVGILWIKGIVPDSQKNDPMGQVITLLSGFMITAMACIALPALIRLVSVSTREHASGISAGPAVAAGVGAVAMGSLGLAAAVSGGAGTVAGAAGPTGAGAAGPTGAGAAGENGTTGAHGGPGTTGATGSDGSNTARASGAEPSSAGSSSSGVSHSTGAAGSVAAGDSGATGAAGSDSTPRNEHAAGAPSQSSTPSNPSVASGSQDEASPAQSTPAMDAPSSPAPEAESSSSASGKSAYIANGASDTSPAQPSAQQVLSPNMSRALSMATRGTANAAGRHIRDVETQLED